MVDASGAISSCLIAKMTSAEYIETNACEEFERSAEFEPALDAAGQPIDSYYVSTILYRVN